MNLKNVLRKLLLLNLSKREIYVAISVAVAESDGEPWQTPYACADSVPLQYNKVNETVNLLKAKCILQQDNPLRLAEKIKS